MSDSQDPKISLGPQRTASSIGKSKTSEKNIAGDPLEQPIARHTTGGSEDRDFDLSLVKRFQGMSSPFRLAKIIPMGEKKDMEVVGFLKDDWMGARPRELSVVHFSILPTDRVMIPGYTNFIAIGIKKGMPISTIRGFCWVPEDREKDFFNGVEQYSEPN